MSGVTLYGIVNCDTIKKAKAWLERNEISYEFHDYRKHGLDSALLKSLVAELGWEAMLNRRGSSWRKLPDAVKSNIDHNSAYQVMLDNPAIIKRPILESDRRFYLGFSEQQYREIFN